MLPKHYPTLVEELYDYARYLGHKPKWLRDPKNSDRKAFAVPIKDGGVATDLVVEVPGVLKLEARWHPLNNYDENFREFAIAWYCARSRENALVHYGYDRKQQSITIAHKADSQIEAGTARHTYLRVYETIGCCCVEFNLEQHNLKLDFEQGRQPLAPNSDITLARKEIIR
jgi:hypothetical protein